MFFKAPQIASVAPPGPPFAALGAPVDAQGGPKGPKGAPKAPIWSSNLVKIWTFLGTFFSWVPKASKMSPGAPK